MLFRKVSLNSRGTWAVYAQRGGTKNSPGISTSRPFQRISPASAGNNPNRTRSRVVLPDPTRPGDDCQGATFQMQIHSLDTSRRVWVMVSQPTGFEPLQAIGGNPRRIN